MKIKKSEKKLRKGVDNLSQVGIIYNQAKGNGEAVSPQSYKRKGVRLMEQTLFAMVLLLLLIIATKAKNR